ncbi:unnamed protein product [Cuscuta epithymum]|uniref:Protein kinase domain-containing protein n=1 Tax=Cuscuta epithymum TaxID=186058 RepID=A0AAV0DH21_9ASTE|nr:unnamed protein product [Cuscuta epithymum]
MYGNGELLVLLMIILVNFLLSGVLATLTWSRRMRIALDVARGLAFLHGADMPIIYRDFKTSNILLDKYRNRPRKIEKPKVENLEIRKRNADGEVAIGVSDEPGWECQDCCSPSGSSAAK